MIRCEVTPGYGVVARRDGGLLWASQHVSPAVWNTLLGALHLDPEPDDGGNQVLLQVLRALGPQASDPTLAFALLLSSGDRAQAMLHGPVDVTVDSERVPGPVYDGTMFTQPFALRGVIYVGSVGSNSPDGSSRLMLDLTEGVVPGAGARLHPDEVYANPSSGAQPAIRPEATPAAVGGEPGGPEAAPGGSAPRPVHGGPAGPGSHHAPSPAAASVPAAIVTPGAGGAQLPGRSDGSFRVELQPGGGAQSAPLPVGAADPFGGSGAPEAGVRVEGRYCERGHFNHPNARFCQSCGLGLAGGTPPAPGPRPPLGVLVFEDGSTFALDQDYVIGRRPERHELVTSGQSRPLSVHDPDNVLSSAHAAIQLRDWDVYVVDLGSLNGSHVAPPGAVDWSRVPPGAPTRLVPGCRMLFGWTVVTFAPSYH